MRGKKERHQMRGEEEGWRNSGVGIQYIISTVWSEGVQRVTEMVRVCV